MMMHTFNYLEYEFQDTPAALALPDLKATQAYLEEAQWELAQLHPIRGALQSWRPSICATPCIRSLTERFTVSSS